MRWKLIEILYWAAFTNHLFGNQRTLRDQPVGFQQPARSRIFLGVAKISTLNLKLPKKKQEQRCLVRGRAGACTDRSCVQRWREEPALIPAAQLPTARGMVDFYDYRCMGSITSRFFFIFAPLATPDPKIFPDG